MSYRKLFTFVSLLFLPLYASAAGLGLYMVGNSNQAEVTQEYIFDTNVTRTWNEKMAGIGFTADNNLGKDTLFNYRFNLEYLSGYVDTIDGQDSDFIKLQRINMLHTFGFGFIRTEKLRVWAGPRISTTYQTLDDTNTDNSGYEFGIGIAPVVGINVNFNRKLALAFDADYRFGWTSGQWYDEVLTHSHYDMERREQGFSARLYLILKFNETFR